MNFNFSFTKSNFILSDGVLCNFELISELSYEILAKFIFRFICSGLFISGLNLAFERYYLGVVLFESIRGVPEHVPVESNVCLQHGNLLLVDFAAAFFIYAFFLSQSLNLIISARLLIFLII